MDPRAAPDDDPDRFGLDDAESRLATYAGKLVPQALARRAIDVTVETDSDRYAPDETIEITITLRNRLPVPVAIELPSRRPWVWSVDGLPGASDEVTRDPGGTGELAFRPRERKTVQRRWDGRFERTNEAGATTRWEQAEPGEHEITAYLALNGNRPADATTIVFEQ